MRLYLSSFRNGNKPNELITLLGGKTRTALISNATDFNPAQERSQKVQEEIERLETLGLEVTEIDLRNYFSDNSALKDELSSYDLVWVRGGNTFVLRRACKLSGADQVLADLLVDDRIVYGGYSAGIDLLVPNLHGCELVDDPHEVPDGYDSEIIWESLNVLPYWVAPHYKSDHPESADIDKSVQYMIDNHMPFIALRDGEVIVIDGNQQKVVS